MSAPPGFMTINNDVIRIEDIDAVFEHRNGELYDYGARRKGTTILFRSGEKAEYPDIFSTWITDAMNIDKEDA